LSQRLEDLIQLLVVPTEPRSGPSLKLFEPIFKCRVGGGRAAQLDERPRMISILTAIARLLRSTPESMATLCSVKT